MRSWIRLSASGDSAKVEAVNPNAADYIESLDIEITFYKPRYETKESYNPDEIAALFLRIFNTQVFGVGQVIVFDFHGENLKGTVKGIIKVDLPQQRGQLGDQAGILMDKTDITFVKAADSLIKLKGSSKKYVYLHF